MPLALSASTSGFSYKWQWFFNGEPLLNGTNATLRITNSVPENAGFYHAIISNQAGNATSRVAKVTIVPPVRLTHLATIPSTGAYWVRVVNNKAYIADGALQIYDVSNPSTPVFLGRYQDSNKGIYAVFVVDEVAYVANGSRLQLFDVSTPEKITKLGEVATQGNALDVVVRDGVAFVGTTIGLNIFDVRIASAPSRLSMYLTKAVYTVDLKENIAYLAATSDRIQVVDIADLKAPQLLTNLSHITMSVDTVKVSGDRLYAAGFSLAVYDISEPRSPRLLGQQALAANPIPASITGMSAVGDFILEGGNSLTIRDAGNPRQIASVGSVKTTNRVEGIEIVGDLIFVAAVRGVDIFRWSPATESPVLTEPIPTRFAAEDSNVRLQAHASGSEQLSWQWFYEGSLLEGETNRTLRLSNFRPSDAGDYEVRIANRIGSVASATSLALTEPPAFDLKITAYTDRPAALRLNLPEGWQSQLEASLDFHTWETIWKGDTLLEPIEIQDANSRLGPNEYAPFRFYRLQYGSE
ncbi:MAG: hypothetical protein ACO1QB_05245 [Verrucomicrobiales bacterium]